MNLDDADYGVDATAHDRDRGDQAERLDRPRLPRWLTSTPTARFVDHRRLQRLRHDSAVNGGTITPGAHDVNVAPQLRAAASNYHLKSTSPLIDIGDPAGLAAGESGSDVFRDARLISGEPRLPATRHRRRRVQALAAAAPDCERDRSGDRDRRRAGQLRRPRGRARHRLGETITDYSWSFGDGSGDGRRPTPSGRPACTASRSR